jgi:hypothetical protein
MLDFNVPLVTFGCSWTQSYTLHYEETIGQMLSHSLGSYNFINMGLAGASNSRSVLQLLDYINRKDISVKNSIAVFLLTAKERDCVILDPCLPGKERILDIRLNDHPAAMAYYKYFGSLTNFDFQLHKNLLSMQSICKACGIRDYYIGTWHDDTFDFVGVDMTKIYPKSCIQILGYQNRLKYSSNYPGPLVLPCGHPNQIGNKKIADTLYEWIVSAQPGI